MNPFETFKKDNPEFTEQTIKAIANIARDENVSIEEAVKLNYKKNLELYKQIANDPKGACDLAEQLLRHN